MFSPKWRITQTRPRKIITYYYDGYVGHLNSVLVSPVDKDYGAPATSGLDIEDPLKRAQYYVSHISYVLGHIGYGPAAYGSNSQGLNPC